MAYGGLRSWGPNSSSPPFESSTLFRVKPRVEPFCGRERSRHSETSIVLTPLAPTIPEAELLIAVRVSALFHVRPKLSRSAGVSARAIPSHR